MHAGRRPPDGARRCAGAGLRRALPGLVLVILAGCAGTIRPGQPGYAYNVSGTYAGRLMVEDRPFDATLRLRTGIGGRVSGQLQVVSPVEIDGSVRGVLIDDLLRLTVTYRSADGCDGLVEGILTVQPGGDTVDGPVTIADCGDPIAARLSFRR